MITECQAAEHTYCPICLRHVMTEARRGPRRRYCSPRCRQIAADLSEAHKLQKSAGIRPLQSILFDLTQVKPVEAELE